MLAPLLSFLLTNDAGFVAFVSDNYEWELCRISWRSMIKEILLPLRKLIERGFSTEIEDQDAAIRSTVEGES